VRPSCSASGVRLSTSHASPNRARHCAYRSASVVTAGSLPSSLNRHRRIAHGADRGVVMSSHSQRSVWSPDTLSDTPIPGHKGNGGRLSTRIPQIRAQTRRGSRGRVPNRPKRAASDTLRPPTRGPRHREASEDAPLTRRAVAPQPAAATRPIWTQLVEMWSPASALVARGECP